MGILLRVVKAVERHRKMLGMGEQMNMPAPHIYVERTLAIIKPDAIHKAEEIEDIILRSGFAILQVRKHNKCQFVYYLVKYFVLNCIILSIQNED